MRWRDLVKYFYLKITSKLHPRIHIRFFFGVWKADVGQIGPWVEFRNSLQEAKLQSKFEDEKEVKNRDE